MKYGFVIDNRKCIGCHACTTACKSEHEVPIGVNRTWVKYTEKGTFPDSRRVFSVLRCNHCTDAPCVEICPVEALFIREDGIVDFNNSRCIGCKSCMQACPYDALYIDPDTNTAAKCNYCAHRIDVGLEPACVNVCPEEAIISGDMTNPNTEISKLLSREAVTVRKAAKGTKPNVFYIDGDEASLNPMETETSDKYMWNSQSRGVGHFAKEAAKMVNTNVDVLTPLLKEKYPNGRVTDLVDHNNTKRVYDTPDKGILWGWEVSGYVLTKAIAAGAIIVPFLAGLFNIGSLGEDIHWWGLGIAMFFLMATGALLVKDLDRPDRFLNVMLRPQWNSWLAKGGLIISAFGGLVTLMAVAYFFELDMVVSIAKWLLAGVSVALAVYTAFLFAQAKGRDFWQSPSLGLHMIVHAVIAGAAIFGIAAMLTDSTMQWLEFLKYVLYVGLGFGLVILFFELTMTHPTEEAKRTAHMITGGRYKTKFWAGVVLFGNILPIALLMFTETSHMTMAIVGVITLIGIYITESIWVEAPQRIQLR